MATKTQLECSGNQIPLADRFEVHPALLSLPKAD